MGTEIQPYSVDELMRVAEQIQRSGMFNMSAPAAFTLMMLCRSEGLDPVSALRRYHIIEGRPSKRADAMHAEFIEKGGRVQWLQTDNEVCDALFIHPVHSPEPGLRIRLTMAEMDASGASMGFDKRTGQMTRSPAYRKWPDAMLRARVISKGIRAIMPGIVVGIYTPEEMSDGSDHSLLADGFATVSAARQSEPAQMRGGALPAPSSPQGPSVDTLAPPLVSGQARDEEAARIDVATNDQLDNIYRLMDTLGLTDYQRRVILSKRDVARCEDLDYYQAADLIRKLEFQFDRINAADRFGTDDPEPTDNREASLGDGARNGEDAKDDSPANLGGDDAGVTEGDGTEAEGDDATGGDAAQTATDGDRDNPTDGRAGIPETVPGSPESFDPADFEYPSEVVRPEKPVKTARKPRARKGG